MKITAYTTPALSGKAAKCLDRLKGFFVQAEAPGISTETRLAATAAPLGVRVGVWLPAVSLWRREMVRFFRQPNRVASSVISPLILWLMLGFGVGGSFTLNVGGEEVDYLAYLLPGMLTMIILFTSIFSTITVIEDRREGFLQSVLAAPVPRLSIVLGKLLGGASVATIHGGVLLLLWPLVAGEFDITTMLLGFAMIVLLSMCLTAMGLCIAWPMDSTAGFHAVMMVFLMPMWMLSGAVFPLEGAPAAVAVLMWLNPLTYGHSALAGALSSDGAVLITPLSPGLSILATVAITLALIGLAVGIVSRRRPDGQ
jgi:ABC-2 type transport system permease protein